MRVVERKSSIFLFVFIFPIKDSALSSFSSQDFRGFTKAGLESKELQRFFRSCGGISEHSESESLSALA